MKNQMLLDSPFQRQAYLLKGNRWQRRLAAMRLSAQNWAMYRAIETQIASAREALIASQDAMKQSSYS